MMHARAARVAALVVSGTLVATAAGAQSRTRSVSTTLEAGGSAVRWADSLRSSAATLSPAVRAEWQRATLDAGGTLSSFAGGWSAQGGLAGAWFTRPRGLLVGELSGSTGGSTHEDGTRTALSLAVARAHLMRGDRGAWLGAGAGTSWDARWRGVQVAELGAWSYLGPVTALASLTPTRLADGVRYADAELALRWEGRRVELGATAGARGGDALFGRDDARQWGSASVTGWIAPRLAIVVRGGSYPVDLTQGFPGGRYVSAALRVGARAPREAPREREAAPATGARAFEAVAAGAGRLTLRVRAPGAGRVEVAGDFSNWEPVALAAQAGGWWSVTLPMRAGSHEINVRTDGGPWRVPDGLTAVPQEFGPPVGLLIVK